MKNHRGFTLIELLVVIAIISILTAVGALSLLGTRQENVLQNHADGIVSDVRLTISRSQAQESGEQWGVHFENPIGDDNDFYEVWAGPDYANRTLVASRVQLAGGIEFVDPASGSSKDAILTKSTGLPTGRRPSTSRCNSPPDNNNNDNDSTDYDLNYYDDSRSGGRPSQLELC